MTDDEKLVWQGIYDSWHQVEAVGEGFAGKRWVESQLDQIFTGRPYDHSSVNKERLITDSSIFLLSQLSSSDVNILDFGGGMGTLYFDMLAARVPKMPTVTVLEVPEFVNHAAVLEDTFEDLFFVTSMKDTVFNVFYACRSFQYVENWKSLLRDVAAKNPRYIILSGVLSGDIPTFCSVQTYYDSKIKIWFLNNEELIREVSCLGYRLLSKTSHITKRFGVFDRLNMANFPEGYRIEHPEHYIFMLDD